MELSLTNKLQSWSWKDLYRALSIYNDMFNDFQSIKNKCIMLGLSIGEFEQAYKEQMSAIGHYVDLVNCEIARRNKLIGVVG